MAQIKVYHCFDFNNENSELFQIDGKSRIDDEKIVKLNKIKGTETTLKELYAKGYRVVSIIRIGNTLDQVPVIVTVEKI